MHPAQQAFIDAVNKVLELLRELEKAKAEEERARKAYKEAFERGEI